ncbi:MAG: cobalamin-binding protein [Agarilytica sp.]
MLIRDSQFGLTAVFLLLMSFLASNAWADIHVVDYLKRDVRLDKPAERIVALAPHIVENLFSAGAGERIVGAVDYCDYPEAALSIPRVGAISTYSLETIVSLKPDLVVIWGSGSAKKVMEKLISLGFNVYASSPHVLADVARSIRDFGVLSGTSEYAEKNARLFEEKLASLKARYSAQRPVDTFYQVWDDPMQTINDEAFISDVITLCGGRNVFGDAISSAPKISVESVLQRNPEAIIASGMQESRPDWLDDWKKWVGISAVKKGNLFYVPPDIIQRHSARIAEGAQIICEQLDSARLK